MKPVPRHRPGIFNLTAVRPCMSKRTTRRQPSSSSPSSQRAGSDEEDNPRGAAALLGEPGFAELLRSAVGDAVKQSVESATAPLGQQLKDALERLDTIEGAAASVEAVLREPEGQPPPSFQEHFSVAGASAAAAAVPQAQVHTIGNGSARAASPACTRGTAGEGLEGLCFSLACACMPGRGVCAEGVPRPAERGPCPAILPLPYPERRGLAVVRFRTAPVFESVGGG